MLRLLAFLACVFGLPFAACVSLDKPQTVAACSANGNCVDDSTSILSGGASGGQAASGGEMSVGGSGGSVVTGGSPNPGNTGGTTAGSIPVGSGGSIQSDASVVSSVGGVPATSGTVATGGAQAMGGTTATGGTPAAGGMTVLGGAVTTGGTLTTGGAPATGGVAAEGGTTATSGTVASGGTTSAGGSVAAGGTVASGGTTSAGGSVATGGIVASGGSSGTISPPAAITLPGTACTTESTGAKCTGTAVCDSYCGPDSQGYRTLTCSNGKIVSSNCNFSTTTNYACYKISSAKACTTLPRAGQACAVPVCQACGSGTTTGYDDSSGAAKIGYCVCSNSKWTCGDITSKAWPCPGGTDCSS